MPDRWIDQHVGDESRPRPGFEDALAGELHREWSGAGRRSWLRMGLAAAAVVALIVGSVLWFGRPDERVITVDSTPTTEPAIVDSTVDSVVDTAASTSTTPAPAPAAYAIGDSVMLGAADLLTAQGVVVDAQENRGVEGTLEVIRALTAAGSPWAGSALVVQVGTNSAISGADLELVLSNVPAETLLLFMTVHAPADWIVGNNELIRALATTDARVKVVDWDATAVDEELCPDGIHVSCNPLAADRYVGLVMSSLSRAIAESKLVSQASPVGQYVGALSKGDYLAAAQLLGEGGLELEARADLRPLFDAEFGLQPGAVTTGTLAKALERWCAQSLCLPPVEIALVDGFNRVAVTYDVGGVRRTSTYVGSTFEGQPSVQGLPLQLPPGADVAATVECPTTGGFERGLQTWADVDGDGWRELLVAQMIASAGDESGVVTYRITTCGTTTKVEPIEITGDGLAIYPLNPMHSGPDTLLIGFLEGYPNGTMYQFDGTRIAPLPDTKWDLGPPVSGMEQMSVGCADLLGDGNIAIVNYTFTEADGQLRYTAVPAFGDGTSADGQLDSSSAEAGRVRIGYCNGLPVRTD